MLTVPMPRRRAWSARSRCSRRSAPTADDELELASELARRAAAALAAERTAERYRMLFEASPLPMWVYDAETLRFLAVNDAAIRRYG